MTTYTNDVVLKHYQYPHTTVMWLAAPGEPERWHTYYNPTQPDSVRIAYAAMEKQLADRGWNLIDTPEGETL